MANDNNTTAKPYIVKNADGVGFSAIPAGVRNDDGNFILDGRNAYFWSASEEYNRFNAYHVHLINNRDLVYLDYGLKYYGYSVRCLKD